jgi:hypothetical protein
MRFDHKTFLDNDRLPDILRKIIKNLYDILNNGITYEDNIRHRDVDITVSTLSTYTGSFGNFNPIVLQSDFPVKSLRLLQSTTSTGAVIPSDVGFTWHVSGNSAVIDMIYGLQANSRYSFTWRIE